MTTQTQTPAGEGQPFPPPAGVDPDRWAATVRRFQASYTVDPVSGCWLWQGRLDADGYGRFKQGRRLRSAHRFSYELHCGPVPAGLSVLHGCDKPACVNPDHLRPGTAKENSQDALKRDRLRRGPGSNPRKLTGQDAVTLQGLRWFGKLTPTQLAEVFSVSVWTIKAVLSGKVQAGAIEAHVDAVLTAEAKARAGTAPETAAESRTPKAETVP